MKTGLLAALVAVAALGACSRQPPGPRVYSSVQDCMSDGNTESLCTVAINQALAQAPRFSNAALCEAQYGSGACQTDGGNFFYPFMAGYMLRGGSSYRPVYINSRYYHSTPYWRTYHTTHVVEHHYYAAPRPPSYSRSYSSPTYRARTTTYTAPAAPRATAPSYTVRSTSYRSSYTPRPSSSSSYSYHPSYRSSYSSSSSRRR